MKPPLSQTNCLDIAFRYQAAGCIVSLPGHRIIDALSPSCGDMLSLGGTASEAAPVKQKHYGKGHLLLTQRSLRPGRGGLCAGHCALSGAPSDPDWCGRVSGAGRGVTLSGEVHLFPGRRGAPPAGSPGRVSHPRPDQIAEPSWSL